MKKYKYIEDRREGNANGVGDIIYILQVSEAGIHEAIFKGYSNKKNRTFILYPHKCIIFGIDDFEKKIIGFDEVLYKKNKTKTSLGITTG